MYTHTYITLIVANYIHVCAYTHPIHTSTTIHYALHKHYYIRTYTLHAHSYMYITHTFLHMCYTHILTYTLHTHSYLYTTHTFLHIQYTHILTYTLHTHSYIYTTHTYICTYSIHYCRRICLTLSCCLWADILTIPAIFAPLIGNT